MLRIVTFKWGSRYKAEHVITLRSMLARHLTIPWEFVLISDDPKDVAVEVTGPGRSRWLPLWDTFRGLPGCGVRLHAFHPTMAEIIGPRFAWIDMDVVVTGNVDHIFGLEDPFVMLKTPKPPLLFNGSLVMMDAGALPEVVHSWSAADYEASNRHWKLMGVPGGPSDEKWIGYVLGSPGAASATVGGLAGEDGIYYYRRHLMEGAGFRADVLPEDARLVVFNGRHKPWDWDVRARSPWVLDHYR